MTSHTLTASLEDYLEAIFHVVAEKRAARAKDISKRLKVNSSSVTGALRALAERSLINYAPYDLITLTSEGTRLATEIVRRHEVLCEFFVAVLDLDEKEAEKAACRMEHAMSREVFERFIRFIEFMEVCPRAGTGWVRSFMSFCSLEGGREDCEGCIVACLEEFRKRRNVRGSRAETGLLELEPGQKGRIMEIRGDATLAKRAQGMGVAPGTVVEMEGKCPAGEQVEIKAKGYHVALEARDAAGITVELL